jgi:SHS2 domain-containing protein
MDLSAFYTVMDHTADVGIELEASGQPEIFTLAALAMFDMMYGLETIMAREHRRVEVQAETGEELLVAWLNELLYVHAVEKLLFARFTEATLCGGKFAAVCHGERFDPERHNGAFEIKAATYHRLVLAKRGERWTARVIFDV